MTLSRESICICPGPIWCPPNCRLDPVGDHPEDHLQEPYVARPPMTIGLCITSADLVLVKACRSPGGNGKS